VKIALDVSSVPRRPAGAGRYIVETARGLDSRGLAGRLISRRNDAQRWREIAPHALVTDEVPNSRASRLTYETVRLGRGSSVRDCDLWHAPHYTMPHRANVPVVVTVHDMTFFTHPEWHERTKAPFFRRAIRYAVQQASVIVAVSEFTAREIREYVDCKVPIVVAPHGVDLERFSPVIGPWPQGLLEQNRRYIFFVGTREPRKGLDVLLEAFSLLAEHDSDIELWIAGQLGWGKDEFSGLTSVTAGADRIRTLGFVSDEQLSALLANARAVAYPSRGEGFGLPVLEALASGAPVVTSSETVMAEVAGDAARLVPVGDAVALAGQLRDLLDLPEDVRREMSVVGRQRAEQFTWERSLDQHVVAYSTALAH
jgi:glycosyltransferase involved in cell wall biosynthesis